MKIKLFPVVEISSVQDMVVKSESSFGNKLALSDLTNTPVHRITYSELLQNIQYFGTALNNIGIKERTHIAILSENRVQWALTYLTAMCFNMVVVPIDKNLTANEIINILYESDAEAVVYSEQFTQMLTFEKPILKKLKYFINMDLGSKTGDVYSFKELLGEGSSLKFSGFPKINPEEMTEIIFTSGSLGRAKGVVLTQKNLSSNLMAMRKMIRIYDTDKFLSVLPIHHTYECTCGLLCPLYSGSSIYYARSLKTVGEDLQNVKATVLLGVPLLFEKMFKRIYKTINDDKKKARIIRPAIKISDLAERFGWKNLRKKVFHELHEKFGGCVRLFIAGGAAPDPTTAKGLREFGFIFLQGYGLTETSPILALNQIESFKDDAAGFPLDGVQIKINNPDPEGIGEIYAKGDNVMPGYYNNPRLTEEAFENGWFKTGDLGCFDNDGFLHISGRKKNVIIANNGKNVFPEEIEDILNRHPFVLESYVYGEKDLKHDEIIAAQIVIDSESIIEYSEKNNIQINNDFITLTMSQVIKDVNKELASYKQIKKYYIREKEFEKTTTQKIKRYLVTNDGIMSAG